MCVCELLLSYLVQKYIMLQIPIKEFVRFKKMISLSQYFLYVICSQRYIVLNFSGRNNIYKNISVDAHKICVYVCVSNQKICKLKGELIVFVVSKYFDPLGKIMENGYFVFDMQSFLNLFLCVLKMVSRSPTSNPTLDIPQME